MNDDLDITNVSDKQLLVEARKESNHSNHRKIAIELGRRLTNAKLALVESTFLEHDLLRDMQERFKESLDDWIDIKKKAVTRKLLAAKADVNGGRRLTTQEMRMKYKAGAENG